MTDTRSTDTRSADTRSTMAFVEAVGGRRPDSNIAVELWDGQSFETNPGLKPRFRLVLRRPDSLRRMFAWPVDRSIVEGYFAGLFDLEGDLQEVFRVAETLSRSISKRDAARILGAYLRLPPRTALAVKAQPMEPEGAVGSRERDRVAVSSHYDVSDAFYSLWLDKRMVYSGAYYERENESLEVAQVRKLDFICESLRLTEGRRLLDIGCGWGALAVHAAEKYGATVEGVTLSRLQAEYANRLFEERGLSGRCHVHLRDYRDVEGSQRFDAIASVEMLHHVRRRDLGTYFRRIHELLVPGGRTYQLAVTAAPGLKRPPRYARRYFMPDFSLTPFADLVGEAERARFDLLSSRGLREQYRITAREWVRRMESAHDDLAAEAGEEVYRIWRLSISLMSYAFDTAALRFHDLVLERRRPGSAAGFTAQEAAASAAAFARPGASAS